MGFSETLDFTIFSSTSNDSGMFIFELRDLAGGPMKRIHGLVLVTLSALILFAINTGFAQTSETLYVVNKAGETISIVNAIP